MSEAILHRLETINRILLAIGRRITAVEHRLGLIEEGQSQMTQQTQTLLNVMGTLVGNVNQLLTKYADAQTKLLATPAVQQAVQDDPDLATALQEANDMNARVASALGAVAAAAPEAASSTGTTAPASIQQDASAAQATVAATAATTDAASGTTGS